MKKIILLTLFCFVSLSLAIGQADDSKKTRVYRPDIPGSFKIDFGFLFALNKSTNFTTGFFPTNTLKLTYQYPIRLGKSKFSFNPGAGLSFDRFKFTNGIILSRVGQRYELTPASASTKFSGTSIQKTILSERFVEIPLEIRFDTKPEDVANSFNAAVGGRVGYLVDSMMKVKYLENGEKVTNKDKRILGLNQFRYGVYTRFGIGSFNLFFEYTLSPLFQNDKGPDRTQTTPMNTFSTGISINGF